MFALKEINQMEREMCGYLEWNLNVQGEDIAEFEARVRAEHGPRAVAKPSSSSTSTDSPIIIASSPAAAYPTPDTTPNPVASRPIRPVPSPYKNRPSYREQVAAATSLPSPPASPHHYLRAHSPPPHFASANSSLASSPASDDCKTPSPVAVTSSSRPSSKGGYDRHHAPVSHYPLNIGTW
jgi:hypothetical protein